VQEEVKHLNEAQRKASPKYYRCPQRDAKLYAVLQEKIARFITMDKLLEMAHGMDTNMNEAFNGICTWFAPKNKVYAGSGSLQNRIAFAVGVNSLGFKNFYKALCDKIGIQLTPNVEHYLLKKESKRINKLEKIRSSEAKKEKNKRKYEKLKEHTLQAKKEFHKRQGTYRKGMNMDC
jgi:RIO-like serine/threonine protein kinase